MKELKRYTRADAKVGDKVIIRGCYSREACVERLTPKQFVAGGIRFDADGIEVASGWKRDIVYFYDEQYMQEVERKETANKIRRFLSRELDWKRFSDDFIFKMKETIDAYQQKDGSHDGNSYTITVDESQLMMISRAVEDYHRTLCGQAEMNHVAKYADEQKEIVHNHLMQFNRIMNIDGDVYDWAGNGCKDEGKKKEIAGSYYLYREILHFFAVEKNLNNVFSDSTLTTNLTGNKIKITKTEN